MSEPIDLTHVVDGIRRRAQFSRRSGLTIIVVLTLIGIGTAFAFLLTSSGPNINIGPQAGVPGGTNQISVEIRGGGLDWIVELTKAFIRVAAVIMSVFIVNILVSFARYNLRVANYLDARADCLVITGGEPDKFAALLPSISVDPLDFAKTPMNPYDTYLEAIRGIMPGRFGASDGSSARKPRHEAEG